MVTRFVIRHLVYQYRKVIPVILILSLILSLPMVTLLISKQAKVLAQRPLQELNAEVILQKSSSANRLDGLQTGGIIEPFTLTSFSKNSVISQLATIEGVTDISTALLLWKIDITGTLVFAGIDLAEPLMGIRDIDPLLVKEGETFSSDNSAEIILERHFAKLMGYEVGGPYLLNDTELTIINLVDFKETSNINSATGFLPYLTATGLSGVEPGLVNQAFLTLSDGSRVDYLSQTLADLMPDIQVITKDSMYKNLSAYSQFIFNAGNWSVRVLIPAALLFFYWIVRLYQKENRIYLDTLRLIGWPRAYVLQWEITTILFMFFLSLTFAIFIAFTSQGIFTAGLDNSIVINKGLTL